MKSLNDISPSEVETILTEEFISVDSEMIARGDTTQAFTRGGTTAVVTVVLPWHIVVANCGDSPAVVFDEQGTILQQTEDHCPDNPKEYSRSMKLGAVVTYRLVNNY